MVFTNCCSLFRRRDSTRIASNAYIAFYIGLLWGEYSAYSADKSSPQMIMLYFTNLSCWLENSGSINLWKDLQSTVDSRISFEGITTNVHFYWKSPAHLHLYLLTVVYKSDPIFIYTSLPTSQMHLSINEMYVIVYEKLVMMQIEHLLIFLSFPQIVNYNVLNN